MTGFTALETAVLRAIFSETPELRNSLESQFQTATVIERENSGAGFFTTMATRGDTDSVSSLTPLGREVAARIAGLDHGMGFKLFLEDGRLRTLEGFTYGESTRDLDFEQLTFEVLKVGQGNSV